MAIGSPLALSGIELTECTEGVAAAGRRDVPAIIRQVSPRLQIHTSHRLQVLLQHLLDRTAETPLEPFKKETVVVQSRGMARWLTLHLARHQGISMGLDTPFPTRLIRQLADGLLSSDELPTASSIPQGQTPDDILSDDEAMLWCLFHRLDPKHPAGRAHTLPRTYLSDDPRQVKRYQLARHLTRLFQDYQLFRPDWLRQWQEQAPEGRLERWQAGLWGSLLEHSVPLLLPRMDRLLALLSHAKTRRDDLLACGLPPRLSVFGASTLPPFFLQLLHRLTRFIPVDIYVTSPTYHYWGDLRSEREALRLRRTFLASGDADLAHVDTGNALLTALGRQGRDFFNLLQELDPEGNIWHELDDPLHGNQDPPSSVLEHLTSDILHLVDRRAPVQGRNKEEKEVDGEPPIPLPHADLSVSVHICHSPMREMEVLRDQLLSLFADPQHADLRPEDVLVMVPDIDLYSPYIEAVFEVDPRDDVRLPISIADRKATLELPTASAVLELLDLVQQRLTIPQLFDFLEHEAVLERFALRSTDLPILRQWVEDLNIRWAMDADQRRTEFGLPGQSANTWEHGMERWILGYAAGPLEELVDDVAPWAEEGPGDVELQGRFVALLEALFRWLRRLRAPRPADGWAEALAGCLDDLFVARGDDDEQALEKVRRQLEALRIAHDMPAHEVPGTSSDSTPPQATAPIHLDALREHLRHQLAESQGATSFLNGRVTFCALKPMRTIPFQVICIAGLDDASYPRREPQRSFDLLKRQPKPGDRSLRDDDRYLFLETLLATERRLILSYVGFSQQDGTPRTPSVVLSELLEHIDRSFVAEDGRPASLHLSFEHRLHPFHASYFRPGPLQSFSTDHLEASRALQQPPRPVPPFVAEPIDVEEVREPEDDLEDASEADRDKPLQLDLDELVRFWSHPCRDFCYRALGVSLWDDGPGSEVAEPFQIGGLAAYRLQQEMVQRRVESTSEHGASDDGGHQISRHQERKWMEARGDLPLAGLGDAAYAALRRQVEAFVGRLPDDEPVDAPWIDLAGDGWRLSGTLAGLTRGGLVHYRLARLKSTDQLRAWIFHLVWNAARPQVDPPWRFLPPETRLVGRSECLRLPPVDDAQGQLDRLVAGLRSGRREPLPFFSRASQVFAEQQLASASLRQGSRRTPLEAAVDAWQGRSRGRTGPTDGDRDDPWVALCFRSLDPVGTPEFVHWSRQIWRPLLQSVEILP